MRLTKGGVAAVEENGMAGEAIAAVRIGIAAVGTRSAVGNAMTISNGMMITEIKIASALIESALQAAAVEQYRQYFRQVRS